MEMAGIKTKISDRLVVGDQTWLAASRTTRKSVNKVHCKLITQIERTVGRLCQRQQLLVDVGRIFICGESQLDCTLSVVEPTRMANDLLLQIADITDKLASNAPRHHK